MGKGWRGGGGGYSSNGFDLKSARNKGGFIGTCDAGREKECSKELINLFTQALEWLGCDGTASNTATEDVSVYKSLEDEIQALRNNSSKQTSSGQTFISVNLDIKGLVFIIFSKYTWSVTDEGQLRTNESEIGYNPVTILKAIFDKVQSEGVNYSKHVIRLIPLQYIGYPNMEDFNKIFKGIVLKDCEALQNTLSDVIAPPSCDAKELSNLEVQEDTEGSDRKRVKLNEDETISKNEVKECVKNFSVIFKSRNSSNISRNEVLNSVLSEMPKDGRFKSNYLNPEIGIIVEALKNIMGVSFVNDFPKYVDFNLRKFQAKITNKGNEVNEVDNI